MARIDDVLYVDDLTKHSDKLSSGPTMSVIAHRKVSIPRSITLSSTPYKSAFSTPGFSPLSVVSPARTERTPFVNREMNMKPPKRGLGVRRVLTNYLGGELKAKHCGNQIEGPETVSSKASIGSPASNADSENIDPQKVSVIHQKASRFR